MKKKWKKRLGLTLAALLGIAIAGALTGWTLLRGTPEWYQPRAMSEAERDAAAQRAENKLAAVQNEAARLRAAETHRRNATRPTTAPSPGLIVISFSDDEINAFFEKWTVFQSVRQSYQRFLTEPYIVLQDGRMILAGRVKELDAIASLHFEPRIDPQGRLEMKLARVLAGKLPLPEAIFADYQRKAANAVNRRLPFWRQQAAIDPTGVANSSAISAAMGELLIDVLSERPADPILFLPLVERGSIPVMLSDVRIDEHTLTLTVQPMTPDERTRLLENIRTGNVAAAGMESPRFAY